MTSLLRGWMTRLRRMNERVIQCEAQRYSSFVIHQETP
jgi:hypothetical protein